MTTQPLGAQISQMLKERGVDTIFGIPGVHNVELYRGIEQAGITHVLARHEQGAGFMADGYARASGKPGVAYVITGPGLTNLLTPLGQAYSDSVPVLAISSCLDETSARRGQLHQMRDQRAAAETVCAWSEEARSAQAAYTLIDRAFDEFASTRARPVHLQVSIDTLGAQASAAPLPPERRPGRPAARHADVYALVDAVLKAQKPLFVFGGGAKGGAAAIPQLLQQTGAASIVTYAGRGVVPADTPLYFGSSLARPDSARIAAEADLVIAVGTTLSEVDLWRPTLGHTAPMIRVDIDPACFTDLGPADTAILADAAEVLHAMAIAISARTEDLPPKWQASEVAQHRALWHAEIEAERPGILPVCDALKVALPEDTMIYSDMTQFAYAAKEVWDMPKPGHWHHPFGFGTLGYALPAAIGGAVARPGQPTVALAGDYGLQYTIQELGTAVELGLPLPILVWDNGKLGEIEDSMVRSQIAPNAVVARNPDFLALAKAYGAGAVEPKSLDDLQTALRAALTADGPTVIRMTQHMAG
ncbi:5-guanidino-2-oxopentanoate decarboxylase [Marivita sp. S0852]|uniref:5-guanidino-2-oxopentanoate decarboxylase n=1 Tax=Marivita sp. S0852 TaxID=3373893 RepID=UPI00398217AD